MSKMNGTPASVGFVGLGIMGFPMARNLISKLPAGSKIFVHDISADAVARFKAVQPESVVPCKSAREVTEQSVSVPADEVIYSGLTASPPPQQTVLTMVPEGSHVRAAFLDETNGILAATPAARLLLDCSTIDRETSLLVHAETKKRHPAAAFFDAPVSGGEVGAQKGTLTIMVGSAADDARFPAARDVLGLVGANVVACGGPALGVTAKLTNNYCSALISLATAEAMNLGMRAGMEPRLLQRILSRSTAQSTMLDRFNPVPGVCAESPANNGYRGGFKVQLMRKDVGLAVEVADDVGAKLILGDAGLKLYTEASADPRCRDLDTRVIYRFIGGDEDWEKKVE